MRPPRPQVFGERMKSKERCLFCSDSLQSSAKIPPSFSTNGQPKVHQRSARQAVSRWELKVKEWKESFTPREASLRSARTRDDLIRRVEPPAVRHPTPPSPSPRRGRARVKRQPRRRASSPWISRSPPRVRNIEAAQGTSSSSSSSSTSRWTEPLKAGSRGSKLHTLHSTPFTPANSKP